MITFLTSVFSRIWARALIEAAHEDDGLGAAIFKLMLELTRRVDGVGVDHGCSGLERAKEADHLLRHVGQHDGDTIALLYAQRLQRIGETVGGFIQLPIGHLGLDDKAQWQILQHQAHGDVFGKLLSRIGQATLQWCVRDFDLSRDALFVVCYPRMAGGHGLSSGYTVWIGS